jgi:acetylornithine deacetylase/succinyl-diaminopimelate desuccinylase-like protein
MFKRTLLVAILALALNAPRIYGQASGNATADLLREIIRLDTSNPPGREGQIGDLLAGRLRPLGFQITQVPTPEAGKSHFIARLRGDGSKRPVLLAAHADVVGVEREKWSVDPFGGVVQDGFVYGRGAVDFKGGIAVFARAVMQLAERNVPLARDVIFLVEADEEAAQYNTTWLSRQHWDDIDCEFALNEGGWILTESSGKVRYVSISTADKTSVNVLVRAAGVSTHSSMPRPDNAIFTLGKALAKLSAYEPPLNLTPEQRQFLRTLADTSAPPMSDHYRTLAESRDAAALAAADRAVSTDPLMHALIRNTIAPVLLNGGFRSNVIPGSAEATVNVRVVPGTDPQAVLRDLTSVIDDPAVTVRLVNPSQTASRVGASSQDTDLYRALAASAKTTFAGAQVTPYLFQAGTDAGAWRSRGVPVYGIYPYPITPEELTRMHGNDERVSIESLRLGTEWVFNTLVAVAGK